MRLIPLYSAGICRKNCSQSTDDVNGNTPITRENTSGVTYLSQEGFYFYDPYGDLITRGWLVYDWRQTQPLTSESNRLTKRREHLSWFNRLLISSDRGGGYSYSITIGDELFTSLTPMTFRKVGFNGVVTSLNSDRWRATGLFSRISSPIIDVNPDFPTRSLENATNLMAWRIEGDVSDHVTFGATFVNSHTNNGARG